MDIDVSRGCVQILIYDLILFLALVLCYESIETCNPGKLYNYKPFLM